MDTDALIDALEKQTIAGCAMDVYDNEGKQMFSNSLDVFYRKPVFYGFHNGNDTKENEMVGP